MPQIWKITKIMNPKSAKLWVSDGKAVLDHARSVDGSSYRLIVEGQGFLDITTLESGAIPCPDHLDFNGCPLTSSKRDQHAGAGVDFDIMSVCLTFPGDQDFSVEISDEASHVMCAGSGKLKPLPAISEDDVAFIRMMIERKYIPYQHIPHSGKSVAELEMLGKQYFPFTPHSFELAMVTYDWTTASFARMVFNKMFEYTDIPSPDRLCPLDVNSLAQMIWESNWNQYKPTNKDYMNAYMMQPADSLDDVKKQLTVVGDRLHLLSDVENRLVSAAFQAMPRTPVKVKCQLFSGQLDIHQLGTSHFGVEFLQCPLNKGPVGTELNIILANVLNAYMSMGKMITTKVTWSFMDTMQDAMHYCNGIMLVANPPDDYSCVWEGASCITALSDDPAKVEYTFPPGTSFRVQKIEEEVISGRRLTIINLQPLPSNVVKHEGIRGRDFKVKPLSMAEYAKHWESYSPELERKAEVAYAEGGLEYIIPHKTNGRRCRCVDVAKGLVMV